MKSRIPRAAAFAVTALVAAGTAAPAQAQAQEPLKHCRSIYSSDAGYYAANITVRGIKCSAARQVAKRWLAPNAVAGWHTGHHGPYHNILRRVTSTGTKQKIGFYISKKP